jgi:hypothetical protein
MSFTAELPQVDLARARATVAIAPVPPSYLPIIGNIAILWGTFDLELTEWLDALIPWCKANADELNLRGVSGRRREFTRLTKRAFADCPKVLGFLTRVVEQSFDPEVKRNTLLHGNLSFVADGSTGKICIHARGEHKRRPVEFNFHEEALHELHYTIADLAGRLGALKWCQEPVLDAIGLPSHEKQKLRDVLSLGHRPPP